MKKLFILSCIILAILISCEPSAKITSSWKNSSVQSKTYHSFFIAALTSNTLARSIVESNIATALNNDGVKTVKSIDKFPPTLGNDTINKQLIMDMVHDNQTDAILLCVIKKETEQRYVAGDNYMYGGFWGYYSYWYPFVYTPGYYTEDQFYVLETNLYDAKTEELIWSANSRSYNSSDLTNFSRKFSELLVRKLISDGILVDQQNSKGYVSGN